VSPTTPNTAIPVTLIPGDGIGPECVIAAQRILEAVGAPIEWETHEAGAEVFKKGCPPGSRPDTMDSITRTRVALKGPLETPVGFGEKSANVTLRKLFETYANVRPVREMPGVKTPYSGRGVDLVIVRENVEDLYAGIEYMQTPGVAECLKLISVKGSEKIVRFAFEYARSEGRESVACATKANIMKMTEGTMKRVFEQAAPDYPDIESWHVIIDNCAHQLVKRPRAVRRDRHDEHERRHHQRPLVGADRRARATRRPRTSGTRSRSSRRSTARPRSTPARTSSTRRR
jgi:isocitrate dehydrogenase